MTGILVATLVPVELLVQIGLGFGSFSERRHRNFELFATERAHSNCGSGA